MTISVVIPSFNGKNKLPFLLKALKDQSFKDFEVLIVVDGSTDNTMALMTTDWDLDVTWIEQENLGRSGARNTGASKSQSDVLLFLDDDTIPSTGLVGDHLNLQKSGQSVIVGNHPLLVNQEDTDFQKFRGYLTNKWLNEIPSDKGVPLPRENAFLTGANFSIRKDVFNNVGGFNKNLTDNEDLDLAYRLTENDVPIYFEKSLIAYHSDHATVKKYIHRLREYKVMYDRISTGANSSFEKRYNEFEDLTRFKKLTYRISCNSFALSLIEKDSIWLRLIPRKIRYRFYDMLITGFSTFYMDKKIV